MDETQVRVKALEIVLENNRIAERPKATKALLEAAQKVAAYITDGSLPAAGARPQVGEVETRDE